MASAGPYASLHLAPDRYPIQHPTTPFLQAGYPSCHPTSSVKALTYTMPANCKPGAKSVTALFFRELHLSCCCQACELPLFEYIADKMAALCYERAWYTKLGGYELLLLKLELCFVQHCCVCQAHSFPTRLSRDLSFLPC